MVSARALLVLTLLVGCSDGGDEESATRAGDERTTEGSSSTGWLDEDQRRRADQLISAFENSSTEIEYGYAENLGDGRGITAGRAGFTTATCDALEVIEVYTRQAGENVVSPFLPELVQLCDAGSDATAGLPEDDYVDAWREAAQDVEFRRAQDEIVDREYYEPAMEAADEVDLRSALARAQLYDTAIQHGAGDDPDGLDALIERTTDRAGSPTEAGEEEWLESFFDVRTETLLDPTDPDTAEAWRESVDRVECMRRIADTGNVDLDGPLRFSAYGDEFSID